MTIPFECVPAPAFGKYTQLTQVLRSLRPTSLEELVAKIFAIERVELSLFTFDPGKGDKSYVINVERSGDNVAFLHIPRDELNRRYRIHDLDNAMVRLNDSDKVIENEEWMDARYDRLRIRIDQWSGNSVAAPSAFGELILSYMAKPFGMARIQREVTEVGRDIPICWKVTLTYPPPHSDSLLMQEVIHFVQAKMDQSILRQHERARKKRSNQRS